MIDLKFVWNKYVRRAVEVEGVLYDIPYAGPGEIAVARMGEQFLEPFLLKHSWNGCFVDVGANIGGWSFKASHFYPQIYAFEPNPTIFRKMKRTMKLNHISNVKPFQMALGSKNGLSSQRTDHRPQPLNNEIGDMLPTENVPTATLDSFQFKYISAIKIDVEGSGLDVVNGARESVAKWKPTIVLECHTIPEMNVPNLLPESYQWETLWRTMPDKYPAYDAIVNGRQPFLVGICSP